MPEGKIKVVSNPYHFRGANKQNNWQQSVEKPAGASSEGYGLPSALNIKEINSRNIGICQAGLDNEESATKEQLLQNKEDSAYLDHANANVLLDQGIQTIEREADSRVTGRRVVVPRVGYGFGNNLDLVEAGSSGVGAPAVDLVTFQNMFGVDSSSVNDRNVLRPHFLNKNSQNVSFAQIQKKPPPHAAVTNKQMIERFKQDVRNVSNTIVHHSSQPNYQFICPGALKNRASLITPVVSKRQIPEREVGNNLKNLPAIQSIGQTLIKRQQDAQKRSRAMQVKGGFRQSMYSTEMDVKSNQRMSVDATTTLSLLAKFGPSAYSMRLSHHGKQHREPRRAPVAKRSIEARARGSAGMMKFCDYSLVNGNDSTQHGNESEVFEQMNHQVNSSLQRGVERSIGTSGLHNYQMNTTESKEYESAEGDQMANILMMEALPSKVKNKRYNSTDYYEELQTCLFSPNFDEATPTLNQHSYLGQPRHRKMVVSSMIGRMQHHLHQQQQSPTTTDQNFQTGQSAASPFTHSNLRNIYNSLEGKKGTFSGEKPEMEARGTSPAGGGGTPQGIKSRGILKRRNDYQKMAASVAVAANTRWQEEGMGKQWAVDPLMFGDPTFLNGGSNTLRDDYASFLDQSSQMASKLQKEKPQKIDAARYAAGMAAKVRKRGKLLQGPGKGSLSKISDAKSREQGWFGQENVRKRPRQTTFKKLENEQLSRNENASWRRECIQTSDNAEIVLNNIQIDTAHFAQKRKSSIDDPVKLPFQTQVYQSQHNFNQIPICEPMRKKGFETSRSIVDTGDSQRILANRVFPTNDQINAKSYILKGGATMEQTFFNNSVIDKATEPMDLFNAQFEKSDVVNSQMQVSDIRQSTKRDSIYSIDESVLRKNYNKTQRQYWSNSNQQETTDYSSTFKKQTQSTLPPSLLDPKAHQTTIVSRLVHEITSRAGVALPTRFLGDHQPNEPGNYIDILVPKRVSGTRAQRSVTNQSHGLQSASESARESRTSEQFNSGQTGQGQDDEGKTSPADVKKNKGAVKKRIQRVFLGELNHTQFKFAKNTVQGEVVVPKGSQFNKSQIFEEIDNQKVQRRRSLMSYLARSDDNEGSLNGTTIGASGGDGLGTEKQFSGLKSTFRSGQNKITHRKKDKSRKTQIYRQSLQSNETDLGNHDQQPEPNTQRYESTNLQTATFENYKSLPKFQQGEDDEEFVLSGRDLPIDDLKHIHDHEQRRRHLIKKFDLQFDQKVMKNQKQQQDQLLDIATLMGKLSPFNFSDLQLYMQKNPEPAKIYQIEDGINQLEARWITIPIKSKQIENAIGETETFSVPSPCTIYFVCDALEALRGRKKIDVDLKIFGSVSDKYPSSKEHEFAYDLSQLKPIQNPFCSDPANSGYGITSRDNLGSQTNRSSLVYQQSSRSIMKTPPEGLNLLYRQQLQVYELIIRNPESNHQFFRDGQLRLGFYSLSGISTLHYTFTFGHFPRKKSVKELIQDLGMQAPPLPEDNYPSNQASINAMFSYFGKQIDGEVGGGNGLTTGQAHVSKSSNFQSFEDARVQKSVGNSSVRSDERQEWQLQSHVGSQKIQADGESQVSGRDRHVQPLSTSILKDNDEEQTQEVMSPCTLENRTVQSRLGQTKLSSEFQEGEDSKSPQQNLLKMTSPFMQSEQQFMNSTRDHFDRFQKSVVLDEESQDEQSQDESEQPEDSKNQTRPALMDPFAFIKPTLNKKKRLYTQMRREIQEQILRLCKMKPRERIQYEERLETVNQENQQKYKKQHTRRLSEEATDLVKLNTVIPVNPFRDKVQVAHRKQIRERQSQLVQSMNEEILLQDHKYNVFLLYRRNILQAIRKAVLDQQEAALNKKKFVRHWILLCKQCQAFKKGQGQWTVKKHEFYYYVSYMLAAKKLFRSYQKVVRMHGPTYGFREKNKIRFTFSFMNQTVMFKRIREKSKIMITQFLRDHNRYRQQPFIRMRQTHMRIKNVQINMKAILSMYRQIESEIIESINTMADEFRQKIIMNKPLEKKYGYLLGEMGSCIYKSSDVLRIVVKQNVQLKKYLRQLDSIRWVALYTDQGNGTSNKQSVDSIMNEIRMIVLRDKKVFPKAEMSKYKSALHGITKYVDDKEHKKTQKQLKKDKKSNKTQIKVQQVSEEENHTASAENIEKSQVMDFKEEEQAEATPQDPMKLPVTPSTASRNLLRLKAANSVLAYSKKIKGKTNKGIRNASAEDENNPQGDVSLFQRQRISEEEICEQLRHLKIEPMELDSLVPPGFTCNPMRVDVEILMIKTLIASKKSQSDVIKLDKENGQLLLVSEFDRLQAKKIKHESITSENSQTRLDQLSITNSLGKSQKNL